jgi:hypothetical protein
MGEDGLFCPVVIRTSDYFKLRCVSEDKGDGVMWRGSVVAGDTKVGGVLVSRDCSEAGCFSLGVECFTCTGPFATLFYIL